MDFHTKQQNSNVSSEFMLVPCTQGHGGPLVEGNLDQFIAGRINVLGLWEKAGEATRTLRSEPEPINLFTLNKRLKQTSAGRTF